MNPHSIIDTPVLPFATFRKLEPRLTRRSESIRIRDLVLDLFSVQKDALITGCYECSQGAVVWIILHFNCAELAIDDPLQPGSSTSVFSDDGYVAATMNVHERPGETVLAF